jgi:hypothetical protein
MVDALFYGRVLPGGLLVLDRPKDYGRHLRALAGKHVELTLKRRRAKRSPQANRYYFGVVVKVLAEHCGYDVQEMHEALAFRFLRIEDCPITGAPRRKRTPETDTAEFSEYVNHCIRLAAELGVVIPDASEAA